MPTIIGDKLRKRRQEFGLSLQQLADASGSSKSYIWELEHKNHARPSGDKLSKIAEALELPIEYLLDASKLEFTETEVDLAFFRKFTKLDTKTKQRLVQIMYILTNTN